MSTEKQILASRANGAKSRGPISAEGKQKSSRNRVSHGILARTVVLNGESRLRFKELFANLTAELQPATTIECLLVQKMAVAHWRQARLWGFEKSTLDLESGKPCPAAEGQNIATRDALAFHSLAGESRSNTILTQMEMRYDRQFSRSLDRLEKLREKRPANKNARNEPQM